MNIGSILLSYAYTKYPSLAFFFSLSLFRSEMLCSRCHSRLKNVYYSPSEGDLNEEEHHSGISSLQESLLQRCYLCSRIQTNFDEAVWQRLQADPTMSLFPIYSSLQRASPNSWLLTLKNRMPIKSEYSIHIDFTFVETLEPLM